VEDAEVIDLMRIFALKYMCVTCRHICHVPSLRGVNNFVNDLLTMSNIAQQQQFLDAYLEQLGEEVKMHRT